MRQLQCSGRKDVDRAVSSARKALKSWKQKTGFERGQVLKRAADILRVNRSIILNLISTHAPSSAHWVLYVYLHCMISSPSSCAIHY